MKVLTVRETEEKPVMAQGDYPEPEPKKYELLVQIEATALNRADLFQKNGQYPIPDGASPILGLEMSGVVEKAGNDVTKFKAGDRVFGLLSGGGYAEKCVIHEKMAMPLPEGLSFEEGAAVPETFLTAYQALIWLGSLKYRETILIHAGASGVGTSAIQLAKELREARIITTAGMESKNELCRQLGSDLTVHYKETDFSKRVEEEFGKACVDLVIDFVGAPYWEKNINLMAMDGRLVYLSFLGGARLEKANLGPLLRKRLSLIGSTLRNRDNAYKQELTEAFWNDAGPAIRDGRIRPVIDSVFHWLDVESAHERMSNNLNAGKIVLTGIQE